MGRIRPAGSWRQDTLPAVGRKLPVVCGQWTVAADNGNGAGNVIQAIAVAPERRVGANEQQVGVNHLDQSFNFSPAVQVFNDEGFASVAGW